MEEKRVFLILGLLTVFLIGCASKLPTGRLADSPIVDPWGAVSNGTQRSDDASLTSAVAETKGSEKKPPLESPTIKPELPQPNLTETVAAEPKKTEPNQAEIEQEKTLLQNGWCKNHELRRWIDNGMQNPDPGFDAVEINRRKRIYQLSNAMQNDGKAKNAEPELTVGLSSSWRWIHRGLEKLQETPSTERPSVKPYLDEAKFPGKRFDVLRTNAAILLGRDGDESAKEPLLKAIRNEGLLPEIRCAAAETLSKFPSTTTEQLIELLDVAKERQSASVNKQTKITEQKFTPGSPPLWIELLTAIAEKIAPWENDCFLDAIDARNLDVRMETARLWRLRPPTAEEIVLPPKFLKAVGEEQEMPARIEMIRVLGAWKHRETFSLVRYDLNRAIQLREAAMEAIAAADCRDAIPLLREKLDDQATWNRAKAVATLRKLGELDDVFRKKDDTDWEVRVEVAFALATEQTPKGVELAKKYIADNPKIQAATLEALSAWPIEESGPLLLEAMKSPVLTTRKRAKELIQLHWNDVDPFNVVDVPSRQADALTDLSQRFNEFLATRKSTASKIDAKHAVRDERRPKPPALDGPQLDDVRKTLDDLAKPSLSLKRKQSLEAKLATVGDQLVPTLEKLHFDERRTISKSLDATVLAKVDPVFALIVQLNSDDNAERRRGAVELLKRSEEGFDRLAILRIYERSLKIQDQFLLNPILQILEKGDESGDYACELSRRLIGSEFTELRRRSCLVLKERGNGNDISLLADRLTDQSTDVVRTALEAISVIAADTQRNEFRKEKSETVALLVKRLPTLDPYLQADAAATLHRLGESNGMETLKRLSLTKDVRVRTHVAKTLGKLGESGGVPILIGFLKDEGTVRQAALDALPKVVGEDIGAVETTGTRSGTLTETQKRAARWETWSQSQRR